MNQLLLEHPKSTPPRERRVHDELTRYARRVAESGTLRTRFRLAPRGLVWVERRRTVREVGPHGRPGWYVCCHADARWLGVDEAAARLAITVGSGS